MCRGGSGEVCAHLLVEVGSGEGWAHLLVEVRSEGGWAHLLVEVGSEGGWAGGCEGNKVFHSKHVHVPEWCWERAGGVWAVGKVGVSGNSQAHFHVVIIPFLQH